MSKKFITRWFYTGQGSYDDEVTKGWFWNKKRVKVKVPTPRLADYDEFSNSLENIYNEMDSEGYEVVNIVPLALGTSEPNHSKTSNGSLNYLGDSGFSVTRGAIVVGKLRTNSTP